MTESENVYPIVCLTCLYPLESGGLEGPNGLAMGLRHPDDLDADHEIDPGYAMACAFCARGGPMWFIAYSRQILGAGAPAGAVNVCTECATDLDAHLRELVLERALALLDPSTDHAALESERARVRDQLLWLDRHRTGPARLALELVPDGAMGTPRPR